MSEKTVVTEASYKLPQLAVKYLRELIDSTTWATDLTRMARGAEALERLPEPADQPTVRRDCSESELLAFRRATKEWADKPVEFTLTNRQHKIVKVCIQFYVPKGALPANAYSAAILEVFGLTEDSED